MQDVVFGKKLLHPFTMPGYTSSDVVYSPLNGVYAIKEDMPNMVNGQIAPIPMAAFARFFEATASQKVTMVRDARTYQLDPRGYAGRDYYRDFRNTLRQTHWQTDNISIFENALEPLVSQQINESKKEHYRKVGQAYINYWKKHDAGFFEVPDSIVVIAGLSIRVSPEVGMRYHGDQLALKISLRSPRPTRQFRQAVNYLMEQGRTRWPQDWQGALWDVRREEVLPAVRIPKDFALALEGQAMAFQQIWASLGEAHQIDEP